MIALLTEQAKLARPRVISRDCKRSDDDVNKLLRNVKPRLLVRDFGIQACRY